MVRCWCMMLVVALCLTACDKEEDYVYPSVLTDFANLTTNEQKLVKTMKVDNGHRYQVTNESLATQFANATVRCMVTYLPVDENNATIYKAQYVNVLHDSTEVVCHDPVNAISAWVGGGCLNLHLTPMTHGKTPHMWGYAVDSIIDKHGYLSLHHRQCDIPTSYSEDAYASIQLSQVEPLKDCDEVTISIHTFQGIKKWTIRK